MARGDVVFYRPANADSIDELAQGDLNEFPVLAAYAQTIPYHPTAFMPWHHVALSISDDDTRAIGFTETDYQPSEAPGGPQPADAVLKETDGAPAAGLAADTLRPPAKIAGALVAEAKRQLDEDTGYSAPGLMPFAMITAAWMIPAEFPARERLRTIAFGASAVARRIEQDNNQTAESCTTALAKAVEVAQDSTLTFAEPPIPASRTLAEGFADEEAVKAIRALIPRLDAALRELFGGLEGERLEDVATTLHRELRPGVVNEDRLVSLSDALAAAQDDVVIDRTSIERSVGRMVREHAVTLYGFDDLMDPAAAPGDDTTFPEYTATLTAGLEVFAPGEDFEGEGMARPQPLQLQSDDYLISPAVLWDALLAAGFQRV